MSPAIDGGSGRFARLLAVALLCLTACGRAPSPPNLLLISLDTLRADHLGAYGYHRETSPFLDELAARGVRFENAFVNTHGTPPSHATLLSSLYQESHKVSFEGDHGVAEEVPRVQQALAEAGYHTVGVTGGGYLSAQFGAALGFDRFDDQSRTIEQGRRKLIELLRERSDDARPVFAFLHTYEIHSPYRAPETYRGRFGRHDEVFEPTSENLLEYVNRPAELGPGVLEHVRARYDEGIRYADDQVRLLFDELEAIGFLDRAVVVVTSDHGEEFGEHGGLLHGITLYDELLRVPMIVAGTGVPGGRVVEMPVSHVDVAPTLLAAAGVEKGPLMAGLDLFAPLEERNDAVFSQYVDLLYGVRTLEWKLIVRARAGEVELYDLRADPAEHTNLADRRPDTVRSLMNRLRQWRRSCPDLGIDRAGTEVGPEVRERLRALGYLD